MKQIKGKSQDPASEREDTRIILIGAEDPLPSQHFWFEGKGYWIYAADQPRSAWREHTHDCAQVTIGLEPAHVHSEWRTGSRPPGRRELSGNAVSVIPSGEPHRTLWQRRASLIHIYISNDFLAKIACQVLHQASFELRTAHLVRDPLIEELGRVLYRECQAERLSVFFADSLVAVLTTHVLRSYSDSPELSPDPSMGLGPARERRVCEYIEKSLGSIDRSTCQNSRIERSLFRGQVSSINRIYTASICIPSPGGTSPALTQESGAFPCRSCLPMWIHEPKSIHDGLPPVYGHYSREVSDRVGTLRLPLAPTLPEDSSR
jgi:hypothetical protein